MLRFRSYISEEVLPTAMVEDGDFSLENDAVRANINSILAGICSHSHITPYITLRKVSKALAYFSIILPKRTFLSGDKGVEVYEMRQYGDKIGMNDQGEFINQVPEQYYLFFQYQQIMGRFMVTAKVVDKPALDRLLDVAEMTMKECWDDKVSQSQREAGREGIQTNSDHGTVSTKKAMDTSERKSDKKLASGKLDKEWPAVVKEEEQIDEISRGLARRAADASYQKADNIRLADREDRKFKHVPGQMHHDSLPMKVAKHYDDRAEKFRDYANKKTPAFKQQSDELKNYASPAAIKKASKVITNKPKDEKLDEAKMTRKQKDMAVRRFMGKDAESILAMGAKERGEKKAFASAKKEIKRLKEAYEKVEAGVKGSEKEDRHVLHRRNPGHATEYHTISTTHRGGKALDRPDVKVGKPKYIKKIWDKLEEEQIDESDYAMKKFKTKTNTRVKKGLHADGEEKTILVTRKGDPRAAGGGGVRRIPKHRWDPTKYNMASE